MARPRASWFTVSGAPAEAPSVAISFVLSEERAAAAFRSSAFEGMGFSTVSWPALAEGIVSDIVSLRKGPWELVGINLDLSCVLAARRH